MPVQLNEKAKLALLEAARQAQQKAYAPYSGFHVGAAALFDGNEVYTGCNVENASYGATRCAEQVAILKGVSEGRRQLLALAVICDSQAVAWPCGLCRQLIAEFGEDALIIAASAKGRMVGKSAKELLPEAFTARSLQRRR